MSVYFSIISIILLLIMLVATIFIAYFVIKKAVKNGVLEAYREIQGKQ